jgi:hypothetical protein
MYTTAMRFLAASSTNAAPFSSNLLGIVLVASALGVVFLAWFLLRGYGGKD